MSGCRLSTLQYTPIDKNIKLIEDKNEELDDVSWCQKLLGQLICLSHTRPKIASIVSLVIQFMHSLQRNI